jgi:Spy/CpxP family protein refolding chaperone
MTRRSPMGCSTTRLLIVAGALLLAVPSAPLSAQRTSGPTRDGQDRSRLEERIRARMGEIIQHRLGLTDEEAEELSAIASEYEGRRRALASEEREARDRAEQLLAAEIPDDSASAALLEHFVALRLREAELVREEQARLQEVLSPGQVLRLYELRVEIGRRIRAIRNRGGDDDRRRRPGGASSGHLQGGPGEASSERRPGGSAGGGAAER